MSQKVKVDNDYTEEVSEYNCCCKFILSLPDRTNLYRVYVSLDSLVMICSDLMFNGDTNIQYFRLVYLLVCCIGSVRSIYFNRIVLQRTKKGN